jgi:hypothetical protein
MIISPRISIILARVNVDTISDSAAKEEESLARKFESSLIIQDHLLSGSTHSSATDTTNSLLQPPEDTTANINISDSIQINITRLTRTGNWVVEQDRNRDQCVRATMGYDVERFPSAVNDGLLCCICRDVLEDPVQAPCEHAYCSACISGWLVHHSICPEDRQTLTQPELRPLFRYMKNDLDRLQIR